MVRKEYPGSSLLYEPGNPVGGLMKVVRGERPFAMQTAQDLATGLRGEKPFRQKINQDEFTLVAQLVKGMTMQVVVREDFLEKNGVKTMADIAARKIPVRISTNQKGNLIGQQFSQALLGAYGLDYEKIESFGGAILYIPNQAAADLLRNNRIDMITTGGFVPSSLILEIASGTRIRLLPMEPEVLDEIGAKLGFEPALIPAGAYDFLEKDLPSLSTGFVIVAGRSATDAQVYKLVRSLYNQFDYYKSLHPSFAAFAPEMLTDIGPYPMHPVASDFYREAGLLPSGQ